MKSPDRNIELAAPNTDDRLIHSLALAFQNDPALSWIIPDDAARRHALPRLFKTMLAADRRAGWVLASPGGEVATLWRAPGQSKTGAWEFTAQLIPMMRTFGGSLGRAIRVSDAIHAHHPKSDDFWLLQYAGVAPDHQGKGWGGLAIRDGIARATAAGKPVLLETATLSNVSLYARLGFEIIDEWDIRGGPHFWTMLRGV
jgi:GNAT superfamily N-acetyltransferase